MCVDYVWVFGEFTETEYIYRNCEERLRCDRKIGQFYSKFSRLIFTVRSFFDHYCNNRATYCERDIPDIPEIRLSCDQAIYNLYTMRKIYCDQQNIVAITLGHNIRIQ
jgi:hypothetical protein